MSTWIQSSSMETDAVVIERSLRVPEAFGELFDRHWDAVYRYCRSRTGDAGEDLAAETFRLAFDRRASFDVDRADARPWLLGLATNLIRNHLRGCERGRRATQRLDVGPGEDHADAAMGRAEAALLGPALAQALDGIPEADRDALLLMAWHDLSYAEVAEALDVAARHRALPHQPGQAATAGAPEPAGRDAGYGDALGERHEPRADAQLENKTKQSRNGGPGARCAGPAEPSGPPTSVHSHVQRRNQGLSFGPSRVLGVPRRDRRACRSWRTRFDPFIESRTLFAARSQTSTG